MEEDKKPIDEDLQIPEIEFDEDEAHEKYLLGTIPKGYVPKKLNLPRTAGVNRTTKSAISF